MWKAYVAKPRRILLPPGRPTHSDGSADTLARLYMLHGLWWCVHAAQDKHYDTFQKVARTALGDFERCANTFADVMVFTAHARDVLHEVARSATEFEVRCAWGSLGQTCWVVSSHALCPRRQFQANPVLVAAFMDLFVSYIRLYMMLESVDDREVAVGMFGAARKILTGSAGDDLPAYVAAGSPRALRLRSPHQLTQPCPPAATRRFCTRVAAFIHRMREPVAALQEDFKPVCGQITGVLVSLKFQIANCFRVLKAGRESTFNPLNLPAKLGDCETDPVFRDLLYFDRLKVWVTLGFLACPFNLATPGALDCVRMVLEEGFAVAIWEDEVRHQAGGGGGALPVTDALRLCARHATPDPTRPPTV